MDTMMNPNHCLNRSASKRAWLSGSPRSLLLLVVSLAFSLQNAKGNQYTVSCESSNQEIGRRQGILSRLWQQTSVVPVLLYSPETNLMFGGGTLTLFQLDNADSRRPSSISLFGMYTLNQQVVAVGAYELRSPGDKHVWQQILRHVDWPDQFYGIGNSTSPVFDIRDGADERRNYLRLTDRYFQTETEYQYQPLQHVYVGLGQHWRLSQTPILSRSPPTINSVTIEGRETVWSGIRPSIAYDSRNRLVWPK